MVAFSYDEEEEEKETHGGGEEEKSFSVCVCVCVGKVQKTWEEGGRVALSFLLSSTVLHSFLTHISSSFSSSLSRLFEPTYVAGCGVFTANIHMDREENEGEAAPGEVYVSLPLLSYPDPGERGFFFFLFLFFFFFRLKDGNEIQVSSSCGRNRTAQITISSNRIESNSGSASPRESKQEHTTIITT